MLAMRAVDGGVEVRIRAQPKASRDAVVGLHGDALKVAVTAAPTGGKANRAVEEVVARAFGLRRSAVTIVGGRTSREKVVRIEGLSLGTAEQRLAAILAKAGGSTTTR